MNQPSSLPNNIGNLLGVESQNSEANAINDFDEVAGATVVISGQYHAFWKDGHSGKNQGFIDLGALPGDDKSVALGLSNYGHAVGYSLNTESGNQRAVVWFSNGVMWDLTAQVGAANGWVLKSATAINNDGWIVGWGVKGGIERGFLLVPNAY
jgi:uncharacterized membrane protein